MRYDIIIIGGGAAGISAALWCAELNLKALLLESKAELGGQLLWTHNEIKNHLGVEAENGRKLRDVFVRQIEDRDFTLKLNSKIIAADLAGKSVSLETGEIFSAENLIIATGVRRRKLNVEGEEKFQGRGIIESGKRDADSVKNKRVCIIGGGDAAYENTSILTKTAAHVTLIQRGKLSRARNEFVEAARNNRKVEILTETIVVKIIGGERVEAIELENKVTGKQTQIAVEAVLLRLGVEPNTEFLRGAVHLDENGYIKINQNCETNVEGIFAVGDVANPVAPTVSSAVGTGATAAKAIFARLSIQTKF
jgi:thioredoxin reductase (NADPH)